MYSLKTKKNKLQDFKLYAEQFLLFSEYFYTY